MALIDEGKLQGNIYNILDVLRKDITCCKYIQGSWMCDSGAANPVWVLINDKGTVTTLDGPQGSPVTVLGTLGPLNSAGQCPVAPLVPSIVNLFVEQAPCTLLTNPDQLINYTFETNIPLGIYQLQVYIAGVWTDCVAPVSFSGPGFYGGTNITIVPFLNLDSGPIHTYFIFRVVEINTGTIGLFNPILSFPQFTPCPAP